MKKTVTNRSKNVQKSTTTVTKKLSNGTCPTIINVVGVEPKTIDQAYAMIMEVLDGLPAIDSATVLRDVVINRGKQLFERMQAKQGIYFSAEKDFHVHLDYIGSTRDINFADSKEKAIHLR